MLRSFTLTTLIVVGSIGAAHADVYRWVDDKGEAHYSDRWVPGSELIKSSKPRPSMDSPSQAPAATATAQTRAPAVKANQADAKQQAAAAAAVKQDVAKVKDQQCKQAKDRYQQAIESRRIYKQPAKGDTDRVYMSDAETDAYRLQARNDVTLACGSAPAPIQPE